MKKTNEVSLLDVKVENNEDFYTIWPQVKIGLGTIKEIIDNVIVKKSIELIMVGCDKIAENICQIK